MNPESETWTSLHHRWRWDGEWRTNMEKEGWSEETIKLADEEAQKPGNFVPMSADDREEYLPPMVLRHTKVGGASIKTTEHPAYPQALDQYPVDSGARSSTDPAPRRYPVYDHIRNDGTTNGRMTQIGKMSKVGKTMQLGMKTSTETTNGEMLTITIAPAIVAIAEHFFVYSVFTPRKQPRFADRIENFFSGC